MYRLKHTIVFDLVAIAAVAAAGATLRVLLLLFAAASKQCYQLVLAGVLLVYLSLAIASGCDCSAGAKDSDQPAKGKWSVQDKNLTESASLRCACGVNTSK
jgi:hypothetical protein